MRTLFVLLRLVELDQLPEIRLVLGANKRLRHDGDASSFENYAVWAAS